MSESRPPTSRDPSEESSRPGNDTRGEVHRLREIVDGIHAVIWEAEATTLHVDFVAGRSQAILGYSPGRWLADPDIWHRILHPEDRDAVLARFRAVASEGGEDVVEYRAIASDGRVAWIRDRVGLVDAGNGSPGRIRGMMVDITEEKRAEAALRREREQYRALADNVRDMISLHDGEGTFLRVSSAAEPMLGYTPAELVGRTLEDLAHPDDRPTVVQHREGVLSGRRQPPLVLRVLAADGSQRWCEATSRTVVPDETEGDIRIVTLLRDISERRALEDQLLHAQRVEAVGRFASGVAHDFNNLLASIAGQVDLLQTELPEGSPLRREVDEIRRATRMASLLVGQLLAFGRKQVMKPRVLDLNQVVEDLEHMVRGTLGEGVTLRSDLDREVGSVRVDPTRMEQAIMNLVTNARDAMPEGGVVTIRTGRERVDEASMAGWGAIPPGEYVVLSVVDEGVGMDPPTRRRIFEPFFTTKEPGEGTGLGLATTYGTVQQSGGDIRVLSQRGGGSRFDVYLPEVSPETGVRRAGPGERVGTGEAVLILEEDVPTQRLLQSVLERYGYRVLPAGSVKEVVAWFRERRDEIGLLVTALHPREGSGPELARGLKLEQPSLPVVFTTELPLERIRDQVTGLDAVHFLEKPFTPEQVATCVRAALSGATA